jgi:hypothetical protein
MTDKYEKIMDLLCLCQNKWVSLQNETLAK